MNTQIRYVQSADGTRIGMCTLGSGRPLVIVTNFYASIDLLGEVPEASANLERLALKRQVVLFDARGVGYSSQLIRDFSLDANLGDLDAVVRPRREGAQGHRGGAAAVCGSPRSGLAAKTATNLLFGTELITTVRTPIIDARV